MVGPEGFHGRNGRNTLRIPGVATTDLSLIKNTPLGEGADLQFRAEFFNIFNRANFSDPGVRLFTGTRLSNASSTGASAGRITTTTTTSREIQVALKILF